MYHTDEFREAFRIGRGDGKSHQTTNCRKLPQGSGHVFKTEDGIDLLKAL
jgi:hypothetical protein